MAINPVDIPALLASIPSLPSLLKLQQQPYEFIKWFLLFCDALAINKILEYAITDQTAYNILMRRTATTPLPAVLAVPVEVIDGLSKAQIAQNIINIAKYLEINAILKGLLTSKIDASIITKLQSTGTSKHDLTLPTLIDALNATFQSKALSGLDEQILQLRSATGIMDIHSLINIWSQFTMVIQLAGRTFADSYIISTLSMALNNMGHNDVVCQFQTAHLRKQVDNTTAAFLEFTQNYVEASTYKTQPVIQSSGLLNPIITDTDFKAIGAANAAVLLRQENLTDITKKNCSSYYRGTKSSRSNN